MCTNTRRKELVVRNALLLAREFKAYVIIYYVNFIYRSLDSIAHDLDDRAKTLCQGSTLLNSYSILSIILGSQYPYECQLCIHFCIISFMCMMIH